MVLENIKEQADKYKDKIEKTTLQHRINQNFKRRVNLENKRVDELNRIQSIREYIKIDKNLTKNVEIAMEQSTHFIHYFDNELEKLSRENMELIKALADVDPELESEDDIEIEDIVTFDEDE